MNKIGFTGWIIAAGAIGLLALAGFQATAEKHGTVDFNRLALSSDIGKANSTTLNAAAAARDGLLKFIDTYKVVTTENAQRLRELTLKDKITDAEKAEMERIKQEIIISAKKRDELSQKPNLTDADKQVLQDYATRAQTMSTQLGRWQQEFNDELVRMQEQLRASTIEKAKAALQDVAKAQGYTIVFESNVAPYCSNDLTDAAIKAMNAKK